MSNESRVELYQQMILEHNKKPRNFREIPDHTHFAEGYNPLCGDHVKVYLKVSPKKNVIEDVSFIGDGCAISKASASLMTTALQGKALDEVKTLFEQFSHLIKGELNPEKDSHELGKLAVFSGIWHYPTRVKCASLSWHTMKGALEKTQEAVSTE